jgi:hypothetical protein
MQYFAEILEKMKNVDWQTAWKTSLLDPQFKSHRMEERTSPRPFNVTSFRKHIAQVISKIASCLNFNAEILNLQILN